LSTSSSSAARDSLRPGDENPFVGPRPFSRSTADRNVFFGRESEVDELAAFTLAHRVILVYAESGAGKTSLVNAGLIPAIEAEFKFQVLPLARVGMTEAGAGSAGNTYLLQAMLSVDPSLSLESARSLSMSEFLARLDRPSTAQGRPAPRLLVVDQFEEILTVFDNDAHAHQAHFFEELDTALAGDPLLRVILLVREDYAPRLEPFEPLLSDGRWMRFRLPSLDRDGALAAIQGPVRGTSRSFAPGVPELIVEQLLETKALSPTGRGEPIRVRGRVVAPVQLQVVCKALWDHKQGAGDITREDLEDFGDVAQALGAYYDTVVSQACRSGDVSEDRLRRWFGRRLITPIGTRGSVLRQEATTDDALPIPNSVIDELDRAHLIREETRAGGRWYELAHDAFIDPIVESNARWERARQELEQDLRTNALLVAAQRPAGASVAVDWRNGILSRTEELESLAAWFARVPDGGRATPALLAAVAEHLELARAAAERRSNRRFRRLVNPSLMETATSHLDAAEGELLEAAPPEFILGQVPAQLHEVERYLSPGDPRRQQFERIVAELGLHDAAGVAVPGHGKPFNEQVAIIDAERDPILGVVRAARSAALREQLRLLSFLNVVVATTIAMTLLALGLAVMGLIWPTVLPLCFSPDHQGQTVVVCPTSRSNPISSLAAADPEILRKLVDETVSRWDILVVELLGLTGAALAAGTSLRMIRGSSAPYRAVMTFAFLKLPAGALLAVVGLLLFQGGFVPGLSALETSAQILAWALVFGYAQQLFTRIVDRQADAVLTRSPSTAERVRT
jgi:hypothetical protein